MTATAVVVAASLADYAWEAQRLKQLQVARGAAQTQLKQLRDQLASLGQQAQKTKSKAMEDEVARAEALLGSRQELFNWLQTGEIGNRDGYAKSLAALARQHLEGVWLTGIEMSGARNEFIIKGRALRADFLPDYIKMLRNEEVFRGKSLATLAMHEIEIDPKGEQKTLSGPRESMPVAAPVQGGPGAKPASPAMRVVEFSIGTEGAAPSKEPSRQ